MRPEILLFIALLYGGWRVAAGENINSTTVQVLTSSGVIVGNVIHTPWGVINEFFGIRYAERPDRFQRSVPILFNGADRHKKHHHGIPEVKVVLKDDQTGTASPAYDIPLNIMDVKPCPQPGHLTDFKHPAVPASDGSIEEDCLALNIFVPVQAEQKGTSSDVNRDKYPILLWIPGDGFSFEDALHYDGSAMAALGNIIVAVANYRVGVFGFISTGDARIPGNAGLSDVISALEWIRENGQEFGGDINNVTLGGRFSGSMLISALVTSPKFRRAQDNQTLAQRIILHGGVATSPWVMDKDPIKSTSNLVELTNCSDYSNDSTEITSEAINCLQNLPVETLLEASMKVQRMFRPVVDNDIIIRAPMDAMNDGLVPDNLQFLVGDNTGAGSICFMRHVYSNHPLQHYITMDNAITIEQMTDLVQEDLNTFYDIDDEAFAAMVSHRYGYPDASGKQSYRNTYLEICGLLYLRAPTEIAARALADKTNATVYRYEVSVKDEGKSVIWNGPKWIETSLGAEVIFLFPTKQYNMTKDEAVVAKGITDAYISFIRTGVPGDNWGPYTKDDKLSARVFTSQGSTGGNIFYWNRELGFWNNAIPKFVKLYRELMDASNGHNCSSTTSTMTSEFPITANPPANYMMNCTEYIDHHEDSLNKSNGFLVAMICLLTLTILLIPVTYGLKYLRDRGIIQEFCGGES